MKMNDDSFFCFGCDERGDVIDLTAGLYGMNKGAAAHKPAEDFGVGCDTAMDDLAELKKMRSDREREWDEERQVFLMLTEHP